MAAPFRGLGRRQGIAVAVTSPAVELRQVSKVFAGQGQNESVVAVDDVSLDIQQGEFFTLLGPSGCGKTTTLRLIAGFDDPTEGEILIQGQRMNAVPPNRRPVNMVFQNYALFPHLSVADNVGFGLAVNRVPRDERRRRVRESLQLVRLPGYEDRRPSQLSGGQQQRVALARALINQPAVLLLDEPLGALDLKLRKAMQLELKHLQEQVEVTFVYVTHDQEEALTMSDRIAVMRAGQVLQVGGPTEIYERPSTRFVADFIGESNFLEGTVERASAEEVVVRLGDRAVHASTNGRALVQGDRITLAVRPERISLHPTRPDGAEGLIGRVQEIVYLGTDTRYLIELPSGDMVVARIQNAGRQVSSEFEVGDRVRLQWSAEDAQPIAQ